MYLITISVHKKFQTSEENKVKQKKADSAVLEQFDQTS